MKIQPVNNSITYRGNSAHNKENTEKNKSDKVPVKNNFSPAAAIGALSGALIPVLAISKIRNGKFSFDIFESESLKKSLATVLTVSTSAITGGLIGGLTQAKTTEDKKAKVRESLFDISTVAIPATITTALLGLSKKMNIQKTWPKVIAPIIGIGAGMPACQKLSGVVEKKIINGDKPETEKQKIKERKLKPQDYFVHIDDLLALMLLTRVPIASKIHAEKILPLIYAWCGYESGSKTATKAE